MSILSRTARDEVRIERLETTQSSTGGQVRSYSAANRGNLPTTARCRVQPLSRRELAAYGVRGAQAVWKFLFSGDPQLTVQDRLRFTDAQGTEHVVDVIEPSLNLDSQNRLFRAVGQEVENKQ